MSGRLYLPPKTQLLQHVVVSHDQLNPQTEGVRLVHRVAGGMVQDGNHWHWLEYPD